MSNNILEVNNLETSFFTHIGEVKAIRDISFKVKSGEALGVVGESGSGKSVTFLSVMRLLQHPGKVIGGEILFNGEDILTRDTKEMRHIRGNKISMIFQDPMTSLNPVYTIGNQIVEIIQEHNDISNKEAKKRAIEMLDLVGIPSPEERFSNYPHEFSGGMRQRAMIAIALSCNPQLLIADEPTTALDVTIQAQILGLIKELNKQLNMATVLITHDLGIVAKVCSRVIVMYGGLIMEEGMVKDIFYNPLHPYTMGLLKSIPRLSKGSRTRLVPIPGTPPDLLKPPKGCPFCNRCSYAMNICKDELPPFFESEGHKAMCWMLDKNAPAVEDYERQKGGIRSGA
ncbi:MAG: peptide ABC transporter ATP-binding protein [Clostridia bacterium BRH_c25]|nr:MAG: peptide ABC transporter ATP-binding protein [Clostridia bacterium BRH_c25]